MTTNPTETPAERLAAIQARHEAATGETWHWSGNTDTGEPYLATWIPGAGRCSVLAIGHEERSTTGREAEQVRDDALEYSLGDPDELVHDWAHDRFGQPARDPRLWFFTDLMADPAREHVVYEVAPSATTREDPKVYRADIVDIRHPDAQFIAHARADVPWLLDRVRQLEEEMTDLAAARDRITQSYRESVAEFRAVEECADAAQATAEPAVIAEADGWDLVHPDRLIPAAMMAVAWELLDQTSDTADRMPSDEAFQEARATAEKIVAAARCSHSDGLGENSGTGVLTNDLDLDALTAVAEAATELWTWHETYDDTLPGWGAHMGQLLYRLPVDTQTDDMKASILAMVAALDALLAEAREAQRLCGDVAALADEWERKHGEHVSAGVKAAITGSEGVAGLQVAAGSVRKLCADELRALIGGGR